MLTVSTLLDRFEYFTSLDDFEQHRRPFQETLHSHISLNDAFMKFYPTISAKKVYRPVKNTLTRRNGNPEG